MVKHYMCDVTTTPLPCDRLIINNYKHSIMGTVKYHKCEKNTYETETYYKRMQVCKYARSPNNEHDMFSNHFCLHYYGRLSSLKIE